MMPKLTSTKENQTGQTGEHGITVTMTILFDQQPVI